MDKILKYFFYFSISLVLFSCGWYFEWSNHLDFFLFLQIFFYLIFLLSTFFLIYYKKKIRVIFIFLSFFLGQLTFSNNFFDLNTIIYSSLMQIKYNDKGYKIFLIKEKLLSIFNKNFKSEKKSTEIENVDVNFNNTNKILFQIEDDGLFLFTKKDENKAVIEKIKLKSNLNDKDLIPIFNNQSEIYLIHNHNSHKKITSSLVKVKNINNKFQIIWKLESDKIGFHHWGDVYGKLVYVPGRDFVDLPNSISKSFINAKFSKCNVRNSWNEFISIHNSDDGLLVKKINIMDKLSQIKTVQFNKYLFKCMNPIHFNDIQVIKTQTHANYFEKGKVGDLLISLRNIHTLALLDKDNYKIKWIVSDKFKQQHSPRLTSRGTIILFDNLGSKKFGKSQIVEIDIKTKKIVGKYSGSKENFFESIQRGRLQIYNNRIFVQSHEQGKLFELICKKKYINGKCNTKIIIDVKNKIFNYMEVLK